MGLCFGKLVRDLMHIKALALETVLPLHCSFTVSSYAPMLVVYGFYRFFSSVMYIGANVPLFNWPVKVIGFPPESPLNNRGDEFLHAGFSLRFLRITAFFRRSTAASLRYAD
jgi:hypothetical protein